MDKRIRPSWTQLLMGIAIAGVSSGTTAFQPTHFRLQIPRTRSSRQQEGSLFNRGSACLMAAVDPTEWTNTLSTLQHHDMATWDALLSTLHAASVNLAPAHGHANPLFGPPDAYLSAGHSIAPNLKALMGASHTATNTATVPEQLPQVAQAAIQKGWKVYDAADFEAGGGSTLPGFSPAGGILPQHSTALKEVTKGSFAMQLKQSSRFIDAFVKFPLAAFVYVLIDFFLLRPGVDLYKEDIEEEPLDVALETAAVTGVRLVAFLIISVLTVALFG